MVMSLVLCLLAPPQGLDVISQQRVDHSIRKGVEWLKRATIQDAEVDLAAFALIRAGIHEKDLAYTSLVDRSLRAELSSTRQVVWHALSLEELERVKYQVRLVHCAQFLGDNQAADGTWGTGVPTKLPVLNLTPPQPPRPKHPGLRRFQGRRGKPKVLGKIKVTQAREGNPGDFETTTLALRGLWACSTVTILPVEVAERAEKAMRLALEKETVKNSARLTAEAVTGLAISLTLQKKDPGKDRDVKAGLERLGVWLKSWVRSGPDEKDPPSPRTLYALERAWMMTGTWTNGNDEWYLPTARFLLETQREDGAWGGSVDDTSRALLTLKKPGG